MGWAQNYEFQEDCTEESEDEYHAQPQPSESEEEDSDLDADAAQSFGPRTTSERKRAQNEIFRAFATVKASQITEKEVKDTIKSAKDEVLSIQAILAKQENSSRISTPRDYQTELFQRAKDENIIAVLGTGSGKTHIATLLLRHILDLEVEARAKGAPPKIAFFLVNSVNLVFQQSNVLRCGLDHGVEGICGAMGARLWEKATWDKHFEKNMVIICTAEVLFQCMMHSFIGIHKINLLIFDEAHHAKDNHPYSRIMKDYYMAEPDISKRPKVFGMTASPVDANKNISQVAMQLEKMLHCKIATTSDLTLVANAINQPDEEVAQYSRLHQPFETALHQELKSRFGDVDDFQKLFRASKLISTELGRWASDIYWSFAFTEEATRKREIRQEFHHHKTFQDGGMEKLNDQLARLKEAAAYVQQLDFGVPMATPQDLSSKVLVLHHWLNNYYHRHGEHRCIVFVTRRQTARLLQLIFSHLGGPFLKSDILVGINAIGHDFNVSLRKQIITVAKFRKGDINCLFCTSVAEEGLDIPQCNLVIRFDLYSTMIQYVQSRGRARHQNSKYLHMVEEGNMKHREAVYESRTSEAVMKNFCEGLSVDRLLDDEDSMVNLPDMDPEYMSYTDPDTGAKLTYKSSLAVLAHFVACLPTSNHDTILQPTYVVSQASTRDDPDDDMQTGFRCEVILPSCSPTASMVGKACRRKIIARCSAAFMMCMELRERGDLDGNLLPTYEKRLPAMRNAHLAISEKKKGLYPMRTKPEFWNINSNCVPGLLYLTIIDVSCGLDRPHQPLGILTRTPMPQLPRFPIFPKDNRASEVVSVSLTTPLETNDQMLQQFTQLFLVLYEDVFNKVFEHNVTKMPYWQVPIKLERAGSFSSTSKPGDIIDMEQIQLVCNQREHRWTPESTAKDLSDRYFVDRGNGSRRFYAIAIAPQYKALDPVPESAPTYRYDRNILDYSVSLWKSAREKAKWNETQPVIQAEWIPFRRNFLATVEDKEKATIRGKNVAFVCPEPFRISTISTRFIAMCYVFPAIIHRFEDYLIALEAAQMLALDIGPALCLEAVTKDSENTDEHSNEKINFKSGMGPNYERLEFLGDCFLKMATSISTFVLQPDENEFEFHVRRMVMLCNKNLFKAAMKLNLVDFVRTESFSRRTWYLKGPVLLQGKGPKSSGHEVIRHSLGDKSVADVCEAFIGAAFMQHHREGRWSPEMWDQAVKAVTVFTNTEDTQDHQMEKFSDYYAAYEKPKYQVAEPTATQLDLALKVEEQHPYHFKYPRLLRSAFVHPSQAFMWEQVPNYQRLEFLGDALLDQAFIMHLFYRYPSKDPQWLTEHKSPMVSNKFLGAVSVKLGFHKHIRQNNSMLSSQIYDYVGEIEEAEREANGAVDYWTTVMEPPKCLADVVEAFVAAMFVDSEFNFQVVQDFFDMHLKPFFLDITVYDKFGHHHPTTRMMKLLHESFGCRNWRMATHTTKSLLPGKDQVLAMIMIHNKVRFHGVAASGRYARIKASHSALEHLDGLPEYEYQKNYGCDCAEHKEDEETLEEDLKERMGPAN
ncbi:unnamed protein product [Periconia digitata]|uniref:Dicer-like protein 1 n=1 Tax=Periconia digitata TaxID=1303443 RepID=A0A9W4XPF9_9PLEO|nr:unnamed protein product [Periconia digitata]